MSNRDEKRQKPSVKGFLAWVNADEDFDNEEKLKFDDLETDEDSYEEEEFHHEENVEAFHCEEGDEAMDYNKMSSDSSERLKTNDSMLVDYEGDDEFDYPDEIIVMEEFITAYHKKNEDPSGENSDEIEIDYADSIPLSQESVHLTKKEKRRLKMFRNFYLALSAIVALNVMGVLLLTVNFLPAFGNPDNPAVNEVYTRYVVDSVEETSALNMVSAVLYSYRSFDTLGEAFVLFAAAIGVMMLLHETKETQKSKD